MCHQSASPVALKARFQRDTGSRLTVGDALIPGSRRFVPMSGKSPV
jgi:hypothetical protein